LSFNARGPRKVKLVSPSPASRFDGLAALRYPVELKWSKGDEMPDCKLVLKKRMSDGSWEVEKTVSSPKESVRFNRLSAGTYQWSITGHSSAGVSLDSDTRAFTITPVEELPRPVLVNPSSAQVIDGTYLRKNRSILFDWNDVPGATDYSFVIYQKTANAGLKKIFEVNTASSEYKFKNLKLLDIGSFEWRVTAYSRAKDGFVECKSRVTVRDFKIQFERPKKVKTIAPEKQYGE